MSDQEEGWIPPMGKTQEKAYFSTAPYCLFHGERGSGKTTIGLHKMVKHCYENADALAMLVTITRTGATAGGAWDDLINEEDFIDGPLKGKPKGILRMWQDGIGLQYSEPYQDTSKNTWVEVVNQHGGISRIILLSMPVGGFIKDRIKGMTPSFFLFEELTNTYDKDYFYKVIQQLGRRATVKSSEQQYVATCNPADEGEAHWVYQAFFVDPHKINAETGELIEWNKDYDVIHVPMTENAFMPDKDDYVKRVMQEAKSDPTAYDRAILGKWVAKITGKSIFSGFFIHEVHVRGNSSRGLMPIVGEPFIVGYDPGNVNNARILMQRNKSTSGKYVWRIIDEIVDISVKATFQALVLAVLDRMYWWNERMETAFPYIHIGDQAAMNQWNPHASYEYKQFEAVSRELIEKNERFKSLVPIRMLAPEKGAGSIESRVRTIQNHLALDEIMVSGTCQSVVNMFTNLRKSKERGKGGQELDFKPLKTASGEIHVFDAMSYPIFYYSTEGAPVSAKRDSKKNLAVTAFR